MEHYKRICPRCGESAGDQGFCQSCRSHMESLNGIPTRAQTHAGGAASSTTQVLTQVMQLEEALAAVSKGISDRIAAAAVEVDSRPADTAAEAVLLPGTADTDLATPSREVARLEDVLKISAPAPASLSVPPPAAPALEVAEEPTAEVTSIAPPAVPSYVAAQALREAFWFEQASAFSAAATSCPPPEAAAVEVEAPSQVEAASTELDSHPEAEATSWLTAIVLLTLLALVMVLTGRRPRR